MRLAILGDLHGAFDAEDVAWLDQAGLDGVLVCGDLGGARPGSGLKIARVLSTLRTPTILVPGNHDAVTLPQLGAEVLGRRALADRLASGMEGRVEALREALGPVVCGGYSVHAMGSWRVVVGRPHPFGGPGPALGCAAYLERAFGVIDLDGSASRLTRALREAQGHPVVVLGHNGPAGLGDHRQAPCGVDFRREAGDWGDPDLAQAVVQARREGVDLRAVVFGHMHHRLSGGGQREPVGELEGVPCVNAAVVPRIRRDGWRHHTELVQEGDLLRILAVRRRGEVVFRSVLAEKTSG